jgi:type IV pilus assembly protein PilO
MKIGNFDATLNNIGSWPKQIRFGTYVLVLIIIAGLTYWFDTSKQIKKLHAVQKQEFQLKTELKKKYNDAANLLVYKQQLKNMQVMFESLMTQLPGNHQTYNLVDDISEAAKTAGLQLITLTPKTEQRVQFYAVFPIQIVVQGNYHQFGDFVSKLASINRIIVPSDFMITVPQGVVINNLANENLQMTMNINTYRYIKN